MTAKRQQKREEGMVFIQYVGLRDLEEFEQRTVQELCERHLPKVERMLHQENVRLRVHVKKHNPAGKRAKYSIHAQLDAPSRLFSTKRAHDWDLSKAVKRAFEELAKQVQHHAKPETKKFFSTRGRRGVTKQQIL